MTESVEVKFCPQCGTSVAGMRFCSQCGYEAGTITQAVRPATGHSDTAVGPAPWQGQAHDVRRTPPTAHAPGDAAQADISAPAAQSLSWPVPERVVDVGGRKVVLEIAASAAVLIVLGALFGIASRDALSVLQYLGDLPGQVVLSTLALVLTWAFVVFALIWTGWQLLRTNPVARPLTVVWTVLTLAVTIVGSAPWWSWLIVVVLATCSVALYFSPWAKRAFEKTQAEAARPTPIEFSLVLCKVLFGVSALNGVALLPTLSTVSDLNDVGRWTGEGAVGTKLAFGLVLLLVTVALGFVAIGKVRARDVRGRAILLGIALVSLLSSWLVFGSGGLVGSLGLGATGIVLGALVTWGAILIPLWIGSPAAQWFQTKEIKLSLSLDQKT